MSDPVDRYCPNPDCPNIRWFGKPRWLCQTAKNAHTKVRCPKCKQYWVWENERLIEEGTLVMEDEIR